MRRLTTALAALTLTATLAACGAGTDTPDAAPPTTAETATVDPTPAETASEEPAPVAADANFDAFIDASSAFGVTEARVARVGAIVAAPDDQTLVEQLRTALAS